MIDGPPASYQRLVLDNTLAEGHALVVADFDGDGQDEIVAGWRAGGGGLNLYKSTGGRTTRSARSRWTAASPSKVPWLPTSMATAGSTWSSSPDGRTTWSGTRTGVRG